MNQDLKEFYRARISMGEIFSPRIMSEIRGSLPASTLPAKADVPVKNPPLKAESLTINQALMFEKIRHDETKAVGEMIFTGVYRGEWGTCEMARKVIGFIDELLAEAPLAVIAAAKALYLSANDTRG